MLILSESIAEVKAGRQELVPVGSAPARDAKPLKPEKQLEKVGQPDLLRCHSR